jgi:hypothetical protein
MAENTLPPEGLSGGTAASLQRRAFLRRAVATGVPVVLATVTSRSVLAQGPDAATVSGCASISPSGWLHRGNTELRQTNCGSQPLDQSGLDPATATQDPLTTQDPLIQQDPLVTQDPLLTQDPLTTTPPPPPVTDPGTTQHGNGNGNGNANGNGNGNGNGKGKGTGKAK